MNVFSKSNTFLAIIVLALSGASQANVQLQPDTSNPLAQQFFHIKNKTISSNTRINPDELEAQLQPVLYELYTTPDIHEHLVDQLLEITVEVAQKNETLKAELVELEFTAETNEDISLLTYDFKEHVLRSLTFPSITTIFDRIGEKLFSSRNPFKIPANTSQISQLDMFFLLGITLTMQDENPVKDILHSSLMSCVGLRRNVLKIQQRLNKPEITDFIPDAVKTKFFGTRNPIKIGKIVKHVINLTTTFSN